MPRAGPIYSLPQAAFIPNTPISSAAVNDDFSDIADALTDSLARNGDGGMTAVLPLDNTGFTYLTDPNTGMHRTGADAQAIECGGVDVLDITATGVTVNGDLAVTGAFTIGGNPVHLIGEGKIWFGRTAPALWVLCSGGTLLRATYPDLWTFAAAEIAAGSLLFTNGNGTTTFTVPDMRGRLPAGNDAGVGRLTATTMTPDGVTQGSVGGAQTVTLAAPNVPAGVPSSNAAQAISVSSSAGNILQGSGTSATISGGPTSLAIFSVAATQASSGNNSISVTSTNAGQTAVNKVQPTIIVNYIIYAGV